MVLEDINYWESEKNYENNIISVFAVNNTLTDYILKTKNKNRKEIADFGCGIGNAIPYLKNFKKIYEIDFSSNMLKQAKEKFKNLSNIDFIEGDLKNAKIKPVDIILSVSSLMPKNYSDFDITIQNFISNLKKSGEILLVLPSFESRTMLFHYKSDYLFKQTKNPQEISQQLIKEAINCNYSPLGYFLTDIQLVQKHWLKDEILFRLQKYNFKKIEIDKLELDWEKQIIGLKDFKEYPKLWFWFVKIKS